MYNNTLNFNRAAFLNATPANTVSSVSTPKVSISSVAASCEHLITLVQNVDIDTGVGLVLDLLPKDELLTLNGCLAKMLDSAQDDTEVGLANALEKEEPSTSLPRKDTTQPLKGTKRKLPRESFCLSRKKPAEDPSSPFIQSTQFAKTGIRLTLEQKSAYIDHLDSILTSEIEENKSLRSKCAMVKGLLEGLSFAKIRAVGHYQAGMLSQKTPPCNETLVIQMFEYYHYGGLALLRGFPSTREQRVYPAKMMLEAKNMFLQGISLRSIERKIKSRALKDEFGRNESSPVHETIRKFMSRCGFSDVGVD